jgi:hypothetical protein
MIRIKQLNYKSFIKFFDTGRGFYGNMCGYITRIRYYSIEHIRSIHTGG